MTPLPAPGTALYAFDMSAWVHRYLHAGARSAGVAFVDLVKRVTRDRSPRLVAVAADVPGRTWRHEVFPAYKAGRHRTAEEQETLDRQFARAREGLRELGACVLEAPGYEADDVLCTLVDKALDKSLPTVLVATDKDLRQLVRDTVVCWDSKDVVWGVDEVREEYRLEPWHLPDYFGIVGDGCDGVPGVKGLGVLAAKKILAAFPSLGDALDAAEGKAPDNGFFAAHARYRSLLVEHRSMAELSRRLVTLQAVPLPPLKMGDLVPRWAT